MRAILLLIGGIGGTILVALSGCASDAPVVDAIAVDSSMCVDGRRYVRWSDGWGLAASSEECEGAP